MITYLKQQIEKQSLAFKLSLSIFVCLFVVFVMEESLVDFLLKYRLYFLIVSVSYFYYYSIQYDPDKKFIIIRNVIIYKK